MGGISEIRVGDVFGRWFVTGFSERYNYVSVQCSCEDKTTKEVRCDSLFNGQSLSCGCFSKEQASKRQRTHGFSKHPLYNTYHDMIRRCYDRSRKDYKHYGGRGIQVCNQWRCNENGIHNFILDMESDYVEGLELERMDTNKGYCPDNCTWVSRRSQTNNLRYNHLLEHEGFTLTCSEWAYLLGVKAKVLNDRLTKLGWDHHRTLTAPNKKKEQLIEYEGLVYNTSELYTLLGIDYGEWFRNIKRYGRDEYVKMLGGKRLPCITEPPMGKVLHFLRTGEGYNDTFSLEIYRKVNDYANK